MPAVEIKQSLKTSLRQLKLSGVLATLQDRIAYARKAKLSQQDFLELIVHDELERRRNKRIALGLQRAGLEEDMAFEEFDWDTEVTFDRERVKELLSLGFIDRNEDVSFVGPVGVGKTALACAIGHSACRANKHVLFFRAEKLFRELHQSRADNSREKAFRKLLGADLLIIDDFGLRELDGEQSSDFYELIVERHRRSSTLITSNRTAEEWISLFDDALLAQSAVDRFVHNAYVIVMDGESYRSKLCPGMPGVKQKKTTRKKRNKRRKRL